MSLLRKKVKNAAISCLSLTLCATFAAGAALINFDNNTAGYASADSLAFEEVTDKFDTSDITMQNFNSSVLEAPTSGYEKRTVIVSLSGDTVIDAMSENETVREFLETSAGRQTLREIDREQKTFLGKLDSHGIKYSVKSTYNTVANAVAIEVNTSYVSKIKELGGVKSAVIARTYSRPQTVETTADSAVRNDANVYATGIYDSSDFSDTSVYPWGTGKNTVVAIVDTGLDYTHEAFQIMPDSYRMDKDYVADLLAGTQAAERVALQGGSLSADNVYLNAKIPFAFDYADDDADVYPSYSNHGTHVAGIVGGRHEEGYTDKDGNPVNKPFLGVAPDVQLVICKTFTDNLDDEALGGAESKDIISALDDCVKLGVDVINMSLGTTAGFTTTDDGDDEGDLYNDVFERIRSTGISLICAASNDYSAGSGSVYGTNLATNPDSGTVGSPSTYFAALSVASISGQESEYMLAGDGTAIFFENSSDANGNQNDFTANILGGEEEKTFEYVVFGTGEPTEYTGAPGNYVRGRIALIKRGINSFQEKVITAQRAGAVGVVVYNNVAGTIRMSLGDADRSFPAASITMDAGNTLIELAKKGAGGIVGTLTVNRTLSAGPFMSPFSSWGTTSDLKIKPEITAHGGEITSSVPGGYGEQSGTSMASPNMAGLVALVRNYVKTQLLPAGASAREVTQLTNQLVLSTASTVYDETGEAYSPRKQGSGLANLRNIIDTKAYLYTDEESDGKLYYEAKDKRPKIELGENTDGVLNFSFKVKNFGTQPITFAPQAIFMTETIASDGVAVKEKAYPLKDIPAVFSVNGSNVDTVTVNGGEDKMISVTLKLSEGEKAYIEKYFTNGMFVEGFIKLSDVDKDSAQCDLNIPFLSFYGDWEAAPMLDMDVFELSAALQNSAILDEEKPSETVWATQAYASYFNGRYVIPMGSFVYTQSEGDDKIYDNMEYCAISRFNDMTNDTGIGNYLTTYNVRCVYAGLLRNARRVNYYLYDAYTGELIRSGNANRISKAYANGGTATPAYIELKLSADELGLIANGKYKFDFEFLFEKDSVPTEENTFSFNFYVDYEAPVLEDARLRYYNYQDNNRDKQKIYLDIDVYDNHYAQSIMLLYLDNSGARQELKLATDHVTPVRNANRNGVTTVSIEVTDIWEKYKGNLYVQLDDYALNHSSYYLGAINGSGGNVDAALNTNVLPDTFELAAGEENITLNINQMHKVSLVYEGNADLSNFQWTSTSQYVAVKNGEIVGLRSTRGNSFPVTVTNRKGVSKTINVTVTDTVASLPYPSFGFEAILNAYESIVVPTERPGADVYAGKDIDLKLTADIWYYPVDGLDITWSTSDPEVATVDQNGKVHTRRKGAAMITASFTARGIPYYINAKLNVLDEYTISNMTLTAYRGEGETVDGVEGVVEIPINKNIMTIGAEAFKDNTAITKVIIPKTVTKIEREAFSGCTALKEIYFISDKGDYTAEGFVADADLTLINKNAFAGCSSLEKLDLSYVKVITLGKEAFKDCTKLDTIVKSQAIGTMHERAFIGCSSLESIDLSGLHVAGANVFSGCTALNSVVTDRFTAIGDGMFTDVTYVNYDFYTNTRLPDTYYEACKALKTITIKSTEVGVGAFENCVNLETVKFVETAGLGLEYFIGAAAFKGCTKLNSVDFGTCTVKSIGAQAFADTALSTINLPKGLESIGSGAFASTNISGINGNGNFTVSGGAVLSKDGTTLLYYDGGASYTLPTTVTAIGSYAFANSAIESITIPAKVTFIGEGAFANSALTSVTLNGGIEEIPAYCFNGTKLGGVSLPASVTKIGDFAFASTPITSFAYSPSSNAEMGSYVFANCKQLKSLTLADNIVSMGDRTFHGATSLESVTLPSVASLGAYTFWNTPALKSVEFGTGATVTGTYTFAANTASERGALTSVKLGNSLEEIGDFAFYNCAELTQINLNGATKAGNGSFYGCKKLATVTGLTQLINIGDYAFAGCNALTTLDLASAHAVGDHAFEITLGKAYTSVSIPKVETIGAYAFFGGNETTVALPATLVSVGGGAFASSSVASFTVDNKNNIFFAEDGVLYRNISDGNTALVAYPSAKTAQVSDGLKTYTLLNSTIYVEESAFNGLKGGVDKVILPYGLAKIGIRSFYNSGITDYVFTGYNAPLLEEDYSKEVDDYIDARLSSFANYIGYYYANFEDGVVYYSQFGGVTTKKLTIHRPENGVGYDGHIWKLYFTSKVYTENAFDNTTYSFVNAVDKLPTVQQISAMTKAEIQETAPLVTSARRIYNNVASNELQLSLLTSSAEYGAYPDKLSEIEVAIRAAKDKYNIPVRITGLRATKYKKQYYVGDKFDMSGMEVIIEYDDSSTELADTSKLTLVSPTGALSALDTIVELNGYGTTLYLVIDVTQRGEGGGETPGEVDGGCAGGCGSVSSSGGTALMVITAVGAMLVVSNVMRRKRGNK